MRKNNLEMYISYYCNYVKCIFINILCNYKVTDNKETGNKQLGFV